MKIVFFILFFFYTALFAEPLRVDATFIKQMSGAYQANIEDKEKNLTPEQILKDINITHYPKNFSSYSSSAFWSNFDIYNSSQKPITVALCNLRAGIDEIDVHLYKNGVHSETIYLGDMRPQKDRVILSTKSVFYLNLEANETITILSRFDSLGSVDMQWEVSSLRHFNYKNTLELLFWGLFGGVIIALMIYNLMMYYNLRKVIFLVYVVHAFLLLFFQFTLAGVFYFADIGFNLFALTLSTWFVAYFMLAALSLFTILFFELHIKNRPLAWVVGITGIINSAIGCFYLYGFVDPTILELSNNLFLISIFFLLIIFSVGIYALYKRYHGAWYYVLGEGPYIIILILSSFTLVGKTATGPLLFLIPLSILIEIVFFSLALGSWVKRIKQESEKSHQLIMDEARFTSIGKSIGMAVHQWKDPLSHVSSHILYLKALEYKGEVFSVHVLKSINSIADTIQHMKQSINDVYESCTNVNSTQNFKISDAINLAYSFQRDRFTYLDVDLKIDCAETISINGSKNALTNTFMTLIDNSLAQFEQIGKAPNQAITISVKQTQNDLEILFEDNAGGISASPISTIFDIDYSSKGENGSGMGLALVKILIEKRLHGTIEVSNTKHGAMFSIKI